MRVMMMLRADKDSEAGVPPRQETMAATGALLDEMANAGVLISTAGLQPSSKGLLMKVAGGTRTLTDGPFTESKELIAGYVLVQVNSMAEAVEWATRFAGVHGDLESELRPLFEEGDFAPDKA